jgi:glutaredoxin 2
MMTLFQYHHCPYCVRADMVANYKNVEHNKVYLLNDDEQSCYELVNAKVVPILQFNDGSAMAESLDIVSKLDELGDSSKMLSPKVVADEIEAILATIKTSTRILTYPRSIKIGLPEFITQSACDYFQIKKEKMIEMSFSQALQQSDKHIKQVNEVLAQLPSLPITHRLSVDDVLIYPALRNLTMVKGLVFPTAIKTYLKHIAILTATELYFSKAI